MNQYIATYKYSRSKKEWHIVVSLVYKNGKYNGTIEKVIDVKTAELKQTLEEVKSKYSISKTNIMHL